MRKVFTAIAVCALAASLGLVSALSAAPGNKYASEVTPGGCETADVGNVTVEMAGPLTLWPPNDKLVPVSITARDADGDTITLATEGAHDQIVAGEEANGSGNTTDDVDPAADETIAAGVATTEHGVRAERAGTIQDGRTYTLLYEATTDGGDECSGAFEIFVPHDQRGGAGWKQA